jgi:hypothetical protein
MDLDSLSDEDYFGHMKTMFNSDGWAILMLELKDNVDIIGDIQDIHTIENLHFCKGQLSAIGKLLRFQETLERAEADNDESI